MTRAYLPDLEPPEQTWQAIERLVDEVAAAARDDLTPADFFQQLLDRLVSGLAAAAAIVWNFEQGRWRAVQQSLLEPVSAAQLNEPSHLELIAAVARGGEPRLLLPGGRPPENQGPGNTTGWMLVLGPVRVEGRTPRVIEVLQRPSADVGLQRGYANLMAALVEAAADFERRGELRALRAGARSWEQCHQFACRIHAMRGLRDTTYAIANESRLLLAADRISLAVRRGKRYVITAVSGVERVQRRAAAVRVLERLAGLAAVSGDPLVYAAGHQAVPPEVDAVLQPYLDETHVRGIEILPLSCPADAAAIRSDEPDRPLGVLIVERFQGPPDPTSPAVLPAVCAHSRIALDNALHRRHAFRRAADWLISGGGWWRAAVLAAVLLAAAAAALLVPADFTVQARGELVPQVRQDVFAPRDGEIRELWVEHDMLVEQGQRLAELTSADLDLEYRRLLGEQQTTQQKLLAARSERVRKTATAEDRQRLANWSAVEQELQSQADSLAQQLEIVRQETDRLLIRSPLRGRIQTWDVRRLLEARPVARGQVLMTVADVAGPWVLELRVPDHHIRHVLAAGQAAPADLEVGFVLKTVPDVEHRGRLQRLGMSTAAEDQQPPCVQAVVAVDRQQIPLLRSGTAVLARIHCGRAPLGYVWLHDLIDAVRTWMYF